jgi:hypothetical protein
MSEAMHPEKEQLPILHDGQGRPFFEYLLFPYYAEAFEILVERQGKYGPKNILDAGVYGVVEQLRNKVERASAQLHGTVVDGRVALEPMNEETKKVFRDSLLDLANYSIITLALSEGLWVADMVLDPTKPARPYGLDVSWIGEG